VAEHRWTISPQEVVMTPTLKLCIPVLMMASCSIDSLDTEETTEAVSNGNPVTLSDLSGTSLSTARLDAAHAAAMGATTSSRKVLAAAVRCALGSTQTVTFSVGGVTYSDAGGIGIAPGWTGAALTATEASWVSACLFAHMTDATTLIWVSVRGSEASLSANLTETTDYRIEEGAFWGNAFVDRGTIAAYSCVGVDQAINDSYGNLPLRRCAHWDAVSSTTSACGMHYAGACRSACSTQTAPYAGCVFQNGLAARSVVTSFLAGALSP
jgi:hypothetical protein